MSTPKMKIIILNSERSHNMKKRILSMLLVVCMVFTLFPSEVFATEVNIPIDTSNIQDSVRPMSAHPRFFALAQTTSPPTVWATNKVRINRERGSHCFTER